jgi:hypothetical protein
MPRRLAVGTVGGVAGALLAPAPALAHGLILKTDLPIPQWLFAWAAAVALVVSFVALATLWPTPRLERLKSRPLFHYSSAARILDPLCGAIGVALFVLVVYAGIAGSQFYIYNLAPTWIYVVFWVGLAFASVVFGDVFRLFNPWRACARATAWIATRLRGGRPGPAALAYPEWLGRWPAAVGLFGFAWLELVYTNKDAPLTLAFLGLGYAAVQLVAMSLFGIEEWSERGDAFSVYFGLFARMAPLRWREGEVWLRPPFVGAFDLEMVPGTLATILVMIGSTSFDGFSNGTLWVNIYPHLQQAVTSVGVSIYAAPNYVGTIGLLFMIGVVACFYWLGIAGMASIGGYARSDLGRRFAHTLLPISIAYVIAHYFSLLTITGQLMLPLVSDPLGNGANIFGTANVQPNYNIISGNLVWFVQVGSLIVGHVAGLALAHDRALTLYRDPREATRSQYWMLTVMVAFTSLGLWILSSTY